MLNGLGCAGRKAESHGQTTMRQRLARRSQCSSSSTRNSGDAERGGVDARRSVLIGKRKEGVELERKLRELECERWTCALGKRRRSEARQVGEEWQRGQSYVAE